MELWSGFFERSKALCRQRSAEFPFIWLCNWLFWSRIILGLGKISQNDLFKNKNSNNNKKNCQLRYSDREKLSVILDHLTSSHHQHFRQPNVIPTFYLQTLHLHTVMIPTPHSAAPSSLTLTSVDRGGWCEWDTTTTCLVGCWCSHRPLASCHLWDRREVADTPKGSC